MKTSRIAVIAGLLIALLGAPAQAGSYQAAQAKHGGHDQSHQAHKHEHKKHRRAPQRKHISHQPPRRFEARQLHRHVVIVPPSRTLHRQVHQQRHLIGKGRGMPRHAHMVRGKHIPPGWSKRLSREQARHLPHYSGYEWHRSGSDMVLVTTATGLIHEILVNVLN